MQESILFKANINECCIEPWDEFLDLTQIEITHIETGVSFFIMKLNEFLVFQQGYLYTLGR